MEIDEAEVWELPPPARPNRVIPVPAPVGVILSLPFSTSSSRARERIVSTACSIADWAIINNHLPGNANNLHYGQAIAMDGQTSPFGVSTVKLGVHLPLTCLQSFTGIWNVIGTEISCNGITTECTKIPSCSETLMRSRSRMHRQCNKHRRTTLAGAQSGARRQN